MPRGRMQYAGCRGHGCGWGDVVKQGQDGKRLPVLSAVLVAA